VILDAVIALFGGIFELFAGFFAGIAVAVANLAIAGIELLVAIFIPTFSLGRISKREVKSDRHTPKEAIGGTLIVVAIAIGALLVMPRILNRQITFVAADGHPLPYGAVVIDKSGGQIHRRTDNAGNLSIPRFGVSSIVLKDARYVEQRWTDAEVEDKVVARRTVLGAGLDRAAGFLLRPAKE
jgi:hypothetical protein